MGKGRPFEGRPQDARWRYRTEVLKGLAQKPRTATEMREAFAVYCGGRMSVVTDALAWLCDHRLARVPEKRGIGAYHLTEAGTNALLAIVAGTTLETWVKQDRKPRPSSTAPVLTARQVRVMSTLLAEARREGAAA